jgi:hypothetical protein
VSESSRQAFSKKNHYHFSKVYLKVFPIKLENDLLCEVIRHGNSSSSWMHLDLQVVILLLLKGLVLALASALAHQREVLQQHS